MKIIAFGASTSSTSINKTLATYAAKLIPNAEVKVLDLRDFTPPLFSEDKEKEIGQAPQAQAFINELSKADAIIVSYAEHNGSYTAAYKNLFDWSTRIERNVFQQKPVIYLATSPGPGGAQSVLASAVASAQFFAADVKGSLSIANFYENFDLNTNQFKNPEIENQLKDVVLKLIN